MAELREGTRTVVNATFTTEPNLAGRLHVSNDGTRRQRRSVRREIDFEGGRISIARSCSPSIARS